jgi:hypothetical protein
VKVGAGLWPDYRTAGTWAYYPPVRNRMPSQKVRRATHRAHLVMVARSKSLYATTRLGASNHQAYDASEIYCPDEVVRRDRNAGVTHCITPCRPQETDAVSLRNESDNGCDDGLTSGYWPHIESSRSTFSLAHIPYVLPRWLSPRIERSRVHCERGNRYV